MIFETSNKSIIGKRTEQQDSVCLFTCGKLTCAIVCDGMGGMGCGREASHTAVQTLRKSVLLTEGNIEDIPSFFLKCVDVLDESVFNLQNDAGEKGRAGTTIVSVILVDNSCYWLSIGDSRLYIFRRGEMLQATRDHNYLFTLNQLLANGDISNEDYEKEKLRGEALTSYIGIGGIEFMDICQSPFFMENEDVLLITTDGLYRTLSDQQIHGVLAANQNVEAMANELIKLAQANQTQDQDNTSFVLIKAKEENE